MAKDVALLNFSKNGCIKGYAVESMSTAEEPPTLIRAADNGLYIELVFLSNYHSASSYEDSTVRTEYFKFYTPI